MTNELCAGLQLTMFSCDFSLTNWKVFTTNGATFATSSPERPPSGQTGVLLPELHDPDEDDPDTA